MKRAEKYGIKSVIFEDDKVSVETIPLDHRVYTNGFLFKEKPGERKLDFQAAQKVGIDHSYFSKLKQGFDVVNDKGETIKVIDGAFTNFDGLVEQVQADKMKLRILVSIFGRQTPVELEYSQVQKIS